MPIRQHKNVCRFEINLCLVIRNELRAEQYSSPLHVLTDFFPDCPPVSLAFIRPAGDNQAIILRPGQDVSKRSNQIFEAFVRRDYAEKKNRLLIFTDAQSLLCINRRETRVRDSIVDPERDDCDAASFYAEFLDELNLHLFGMNENVVCEPILESECKPIEARIL